MTSKKRTSIITPPPEMEPGTTIEGGTLDEVLRKEELLKLIRKGAPSVPVADRPKKEHDLRTKATFRIPRSLVARYEQAAAARTIPTPVNSWMIEAIVEKLRKDGC